jgi:hypothetical protein
MSRYTASTFDSNLLQITDNESNQIVYKENLLASVKESIRDLQKVCDILNAESARADRAEQMACELGAIITEADDDLDREDTRHLKEGDTYDTTNFTETLKRGRARARTEPVAGRWVSRDDVVAIEEWRTRGGVMESIETALTGKRVAYASERLTTATDAVVGLRAERDALEAWRIDLFQEFKELMGLPEDTDTSDTLHHMRLRIDERDAIKTEVEAMRAVVDATSLFLDEVESINDEEHNKAGRDPVMVAANKAADVREALDALRAREVKFTNIDKAPAQGEIKE